LVVAEVLIGLAALHRRSRGAAAAVGFVLAIAIWIVAQDLGQLHTGQATDPNSGLIIALFAIAVFSLRPARFGARASWRRAGGVEPVVRHLCPSTGQQVGPNSCQWGR
jgi:hypothetical protein